MNRVKSRSWIAFWMLAMVALCAMAFIYVNKEGFSDPASRKEVSGIDADAQSSNLEELVGPAKESPASSPELAGGTATRAVLLARLYASKTFSELQVNSLMLPAHDPDVFALKRGSIAFCNLTSALADSQNSSAEVPLPDTNAARQSLQLTLDFAARYCPSRQDREQLIGQGPTYFDELSEITQNTESSDFRLVEQIASIDEATLLDTEKAEHVAQLETILRTTESPEAAEAAGNLLASGRLGQWNAGSDLVAGTPMEPRLLDLQSAAVILRRCELSRACGPLSLQVMRLCAPAQCDSFSSVSDFFRRQFSPTEFEVIEAISAQFRG